MGVLARDRESIKRNDFYALSIKRKREEEARERRKDFLEKKKRFAAMNWKKRENLKKFERKNKIICKKGILFSIYRKIGKAKEEEKKGTEG